MEEKKVYVVTKGEYSDYHICRVFLDKEEAEKYKESISDESYNGQADIEEFVVGKPNEEWKLGWWVQRWVNDPNKTVPDPKLKEYEVKWTAKFIGEIGDEYDEGDVFWNDEAKAKYDVFEVERFGEMAFYLVAPNMKTALKIANERYAKIQVEQDLTHRFEINKEYKYYSEL